MSVMRFTKKFSNERYAQATQSWQWLDLAGKTPLFTSLFGDVFFRASDGVWWLDTLEGSLTRPWPTDEQMRAKLNTAEGQDRYLLAGLAESVARKGLIPGEDEVYDFTISPVLGGPIEATNIDVTDVDDDGHLRLSTR
jgi:hypothetical protein